MAADPPNKKPSDETPAGAESPSPSPAAPAVLPYASGLPEPRPRARRWFAISFCVYAATVYGSQLRWWALTYPTRPHHYVEQARAWFHGHLDIDPNLDLPDLSAANGRLYSCFPPGPTLVLFLPSVLLNGRVPDLLIHCLLAAASVALMHQALWLIAKRTGTTLSSDTLEWLTALYALGTVIWVNIPYRGVWYMAHWFALVGLTGALYLAARGRPLSTGFAWALAFASRPPCVGAFPLLVYLLYGHFRQGPSRRMRLRRMAGFLIGPTMMVAFMAWLNTAQFGSPLDFGRARMRVASPYADRLAKGVFSTVFVGENVRAFFLNPPQIIKRPPYVISRNEGTGLFWTSPAFLCLFAAIRRKRLAAVCWLAAGLTFLPMLFYYGHESCATGARYLLDFYPILFVLLMLAVGSPIRWWAKILIAVDMAYTFAWVWYLFLSW